MNNEVWKDIPGYEGYYEASTKGRIRSVERLVKNRYGDMKIKGRILKSSKNKGGYPCVVLCKKGIMKSGRVHSFVAITFLGHVPCGLDMVINHINHIRDDNRVENLEIITNRENTSRKHINSSSKFVGVSWHKARRKWQADITFKNKVTYLGRFLCETRAHIEYLRALKKGSVF